MASTAARQEVVFGVAVSFTCASVLLVGLRVYTRAILVRNFGKDDCAMLAALFSVLGYLVTLIVQRYNGMGHPRKDLTPDQITTSIKTVLAIEILYYLCVNCIKISIVLFYLRLLLKDVTRRLCQATIAFIATFGIICLVVTFTQCVPLRKMWDFTGMVHGKCIHLTLFFYFTSSFNILIDIWILVLPIEFLVRMERPVREKTALIFIFALGGLSVIASCIRLYTICIYTESTEPFVDCVPINTWSMVEINIGIYCACLPALRALVSKMKNKYKRTPRGTFHLRDSGDTDKGGEVAKLRTHELS